MHCILKHFPIVIDYDEHSYILQDNCRMRYYEFWKQLFRSILIKILIFEFSSEVRMKWMNSGRSLDKHH